MYALRSPHEAYRRVEFDARVAGSDPRELVLVCYEQFDAALVRGLAAERAGDNLAKSEALTRAVTALTALQLGIDPAAALAPALESFYAAARRTLLDNVLDFSAEAIATLRGDFADVRRSLEANR